MNFMFNLEEYTTVRERIIEFWNRNPNGRIETEILEWSDKRFIVAARLYRNVEDTKPFSTGLAHEAITDRGVNKDFALENGATSAIGIACANANIGIEKHKASREEMKKVAPNHPALTVVPDSIDIDYWNTSFKDQAVITEIVNTELDIPSCVHGAMLWQTGVSQKNGKEWARMTCQSKGQTGGMDQCPPIWYNIGSDGKWKPQKVRV
jgi:hypothetical protein